MDLQISRSLLSDQAYDLVRRSILDGSFAPGERLVESEIARRMSVSQAPVREAIKKLVHDGLVTSIPRMGSYVTEVSQDEFKVARDMRGALEQVGAGLAAEHVIDQNLDDLRTIVTHMRHSIDKNDWAQFRMKDMEFHRYVLAIGNQKVLMRLWAALEPVLLSSGAIADPRFTARDELPGWHEELIDILASGDPVAARRAFYAHAVGANESG